MPMTIATTIARLAERKAAGEPISMLTAYDATLARAIEAAGVECILIGDSLGNVVQGRRSTVPVTVDQMVYHVECVRRGTSRSLLIADMPFLSYSDRATSIETARRLMQAGAAMVKLEGGQPVLESVNALVSLGVPVCAHLGLTPQSVHQLSGYRVQGRDPVGRQRMVDDAHALAENGASLLVLECVPTSLAAEITAALDIPVIGIGAGRSVDGQVLVVHDLLGLGGAHRPRFVRDFLSGKDGIGAAFEAYVAAVRDRSFPSDDESFVD